MNKISKKMATVHVGVVISGINVQFKASGKMTDDSLVDRSIQAYEGLDSRYKAEVSEIKFERSIYSPADLKKIDEWLSYNEFRIEEQASQMISDIAI